MITLKVVSHLPQNKDSIEQLSHITAEVHAKAASISIKELHLTEEQFITLMDKIEHKENN